MSPEDFAKDYACRAHKDQLYGDLPYWVHLSEVETVLEDFEIRNEDLKIAAWLHDILEDTPTTTDQLELMFGSTVTRIVFAVTGKGKNRKERNAWIYNQLHSTPEAVILKLADRIANAEASAKNNPSMLAMYKKEHDEFKRELRVPSLYAQQWEGIEEGLLERMWERLDKVLRRSTTKPTTV
jgi:(p)ppGpp synthase/HD superfamily hydrolase